MNKRCIVSISMVVVGLGILIAILIANNLQKVTVTETVESAVEICVQQPVAEEVEVPTRQTATEVAKEFEEEIVEEPVEEKPKWEGPVLNSRNGVVQGPNGKETYYNLNMSGVIKIMRSQGFSEDEYPYSVREDGVKMFGPYVMCAANLELRPRGTIIETSLGTAIVCDTGSFARKNPKQLDIAVDW